MWSIANWNERPYLVTGHKCLSVFFLTPSHQKQQNKLNTNKARPYGKSILAEHLILLHLNIEVCFVWAKTPFSSRATVATYLALRC